MSKIGRFLNIIDIITKNIEKDRVEDGEYQHKLAKDFKTAFVSVYAKESVNAIDCETDKGYALIPAFIKNSIGNEYVGLVDICVLDGGELNASQTQFLTNDYGWVTLERLREVISELELQFFFPFKYKPLIKIEDCYKTSNQYE
ncbi:hypothetical protein ACWA2B_10740 [Paenibacillus sp. CMM36]